MKKLFIGSIFFAALSIFSCQALFADEAGIMQKLDEISQKQDQILSSLEQVKSELAIVKVRASNR